MKIVKYKNNEHLDIWDKYVQKSNNGTETEPTWNQHGNKHGTKLEMEQKWNRHGTGMELNWNRNRNKTLIYTELLSRRGSHWLTYIYIYKI